MYIDIYSYIYTYMNIIKDWTSQSYKHEIIAVIFHLIFNFNFSRVCNCNSLHHNKINGLRFLLEILHISIYIYFLAILCQLKIMGVLNISKRIRYFGIHTTLRLTINRRDKHWFYHTTMKTTKLVTRHPKSMQCQINHATVRLFNKHGQNEICHEPQTRSANGNEIRIGFGDSVWTWADLQNFRILQHSICWQGSGTTDFSAVSCRVQWKYHENRKSEKYAYKLSPLKRAKNEYVMIEL